MSSSSTIVTYVLIPCNINEALEERSYHNDKDQQGVEDDAESLVVEAFFGNETSIKQTLLVRSTESQPGLYAYSAGDSVSNHNVRATRLAMACGLWSLRFRGPVLLFRHHATSLLSSNVQIAACVSPDLRPLLWKELICLSNHVPTWLQTAVQQNYHDQVVLEKFAKVMSRTLGKTDDEDAGEEEEGEENDDDEAIDAAYRPFLAKSPLCLHCRGPCDDLCPNCHGVYFCISSNCRTQCWSHDCVCDTWKLYTDRRAVLQDLPLGDWHSELMTRDYQVSEEPYRRFLQERLGISIKTSSWWRTETHGWAGGRSDSAQTVDPTIRHSYQQGFAPVDAIPPQRRPTQEELETQSTDSMGLVHLQSWSDYYQFRQIPLSSPVALLLTFPLTVYHGLTLHGQVPITVARMLRRPLRIHLVGVEKELNFLDLFQELGYLLPEDLEVELVLVVRRDMLPPKAACSLQVRLTSNLVAEIVSGTYGDDLDPNFDCGSGPPDMIFGLNAGLLAYKSWRSVIEYLYEHKGVVGVFTDYNEHSGVHCAGLGGDTSSLRMNPFRQPRAMPVFSMNLPQFSNGFIYAFNEQELDD